MSLAHTAAEYMLSDALLPDRRGSRLKGLRLELPLDQIVKFVAVGFPLLLMSLAFAQEFSSGKLLQKPSERPHFTLCMTSKMRSLLH
jgi:pannexin